MPNLNVFSLLRSPRPLLGTLGLLFALTAGTSASAKDFNWQIVSRDPQPESLASLKQLESLHTQVMKSIARKTSNAESLRATNTLLKKLGLPEVDVESKDLRVTLTDQVGFDRSTTVGVEIRDGKHRFCLPCNFSHNDFRVGITKYEKSARNLSGAFYPVMKCFEDIQAFYTSDLSGYVNKSNWPQKRFLPVAVDAGAVIITDDYAALYPVPPTNKIVDFVRAQLPDGLVVELRQVANRAGSKPSFSESTLNLAQSAPLLAQAIDSAELEKMITSTIDQQLERLLEGEHFYASAPLAVKCQAVKSCSATRLPMRKIELNCE